jgi:enoyl-CoA hydratase/carnithine racemase
LTFDNYADLRDLLHELPQRGDVRVLVLRGEGKAFCAGGDVNEIIGELIQMDARDLMAFTKMTGDVIKAMRECPIPIISGVRGVAAGAGAVVVLASDFRIVAHSGKFAFLFTKVGLSGGDMGTAYLLPRVVGAGRATQMLMLGDTVDATTAQTYGLVSQLVADDELDAAATHPPSSRGADDHRARSLGWRPAVPTWREGFRTFGAAVASRPRSAAAGHNSGGPKR